MARPKVILFLYNRFFDPVIQSNFWLYIRSLLDEAPERYEFHLITYEDPKFPLTAEQQRQVETWRGQGLRWTPLPWHQGTSLKYKAKDVFAGFRVAVNLRRQGYRSIVSLASVAGAYAYLYARVLGLSLYMYQYEPHSEYALDNRMWKRESPQYRMMHLLERWSAAYAKVISSGTRFMQDRLQNQWQVPARFFKIPSVADDQKFTFNPDDRARIRTQLNIPADAPVLIYPGKFGDLYYRAETAFAFRWLREAEPRLHLMIITPHRDEEVYDLFDQAGVDRAAYSISHSDYTGIHQYYSAADMGVIAVPPGPSKQFISNIKVGEYLCSGLPYLITRGVSEDYCYAEERGVGVVVDTFDEADIRAAWPEIQRYLTSDKEALRKHCRQVGIEYRGFVNLNPVFRQALAHLTGSLAD